MKLYSSVLHAGLVLGSCASLTASPPVNLVANGSFKDTSWTLASSWRLSDFATGGATASVALGQGRDGANALKLEYPVHPTAVSSPDPLLAPGVSIEQEGIALNVSDPYTLSFWIRSDNIYGKHVRVALLDASEQECVGLSESLYATPNWQRHEFHFQWWLNKAPDKTKLRFTLEEFGTLWIDGVSITCSVPTIPRYTPQLSPGTGPNLLPNGSFEVGRQGWFTLGTKTAWGGDLAGLFGEISEDTPLEGRKSLKIEMGAGKSPVTFYDCWPAARVVQDTLLAANLGWIDVTPGEQYTLSAYMKANRQGVVGRLQIHQAKTPLAEGIEESHKDVELTEDWARYTLSVKAQTSQIFVAVGPDITASPGIGATTWLSGVQFESGSIPTPVVQRDPVEIGFEVAPGSRIYSPQEGPKITVHAASNLSAACQVLLHATVRDYFGRIAARSQLLMDVPAAAKAESSWQLSQLGRGFFTATLEWTVGGAHQEREIRLSILDPFPWKDSLFGINHAPVTDGLCATLQGAGILWARDWSLNWGLLEPQKGQLSFASSDQQLDRLKSEGFNIISLLPPLPSADWASSAPASVKPELWNRMAYRPTDPDLLFDFVRKAVEHSRDRVHVWEFLNEPVWTGFCLPQSAFNKPDANYTPADYVALLKHAYPVIKAADPQGRVIGGFASQPWHFSRDFMDLGGLESIDVFNIHNYGTTRPPESFIAEMETLLGQMDAHGGRKPIWLTEYSYYGTDQSPWEPWSPPSNEWAANLLLRDERQCADWSIRYNVIMLAHGVEKIFYHSGMSSAPNSGSSSLECALLAPGGEPRKLYAAQATLASLLGPDCKFKGNMKIGETSGRRSTKGIYGYAFQCGKSSVMPIWIDEAATKKSRWLVQLPTGVRALDMMGNTLERSKAALDVSPIYLVSDVLSAAQLAGACTLSASEETTNSHRN